MPVLENISKAYLCGGDGLAPNAVVEDAAIVWLGEQLEWVGARSELPPVYLSEAKVDAEGGIVIPGLIDCHTHLVFSGWRTGDFMDRIQGAHYASSHNLASDHARGVATTLEQTRAASIQALTERGLQFCDSMIKLGVTTVEAKSGYGLTIESELKILRAIHEIDSRSQIDVCATFLGAHFIPGEFKGRRQSYVEMICDEMLPLVAEQRLARFCDVFVESIAFSPEEAQKIAAVAHSHGLKLKLHVDQLADGGGADLASSLGAISADHLEYTAEDAMPRMADAGVVGVILPFASWYLKDRFADGRKLIDHGVRVAVATDFNPGSAPSYHLPFALSMACINCGLLPHEALQGATINAAHALGLADSIGSLEQGKQADIVVLNAESLVHWLYHLQANAVAKVIKRGVVVVGS